MTDSRNAKVAGSSVWEAMEGGVQCVVTEAARQLIWSIKELASTTYP